MKNEYWRYEIRFGTDEQKDVLSALLAEWGVEGFEEQDELLFASGKLGEIDIESIENYLTNNDITYSKSIIENKNWNEVWESNFEAVRVEDFVGVRAAFHQPFENVLHEIVITPKMSFGTGHHATTWLVLKSMKELPLKGSKVFDFGTGTGILAIMAEKLGAADVLAVDHDDWCIENATENVEQNRCERIRVEKSDSAAGNDVYDIILANINKNVILENLQQLDEILKVGGHLVLSGLLTDDETEILENIADLNFLVVRILEKNGWIAIDLQKQE